MPPLFYHACFGQYIFQKSTSPDQIFIVCRILFLATASGPSFIQTLVEEKHHGRYIVDIIGAKLDSLTISILSGTRMAREAMSDILKFTFNLLLHYPKVHFYQNLQIDSNFCIRWSKLSLKPQKPRTTMNPKF